METQTKKTIGTQGESAVVAWLVDHGFTILATNFRTRRGEIDIIATKKEVVSFVEVKTRNTIYFPVSQVITPAKQRRIISAAVTFTLQNHIQDKVLRFDVAIVTTVANSTEITFIQNAFNAQ